MDEFQQKMIEAMAEMKVELRGLDAGNSRIENHLSRVNGRVGKNESAIGTHLASHAADKELTAAVTIARKDIALTWTGVAKLGVLLTIASGAAGAAWQVIERWH